MKKITLFLTLAGLLLLTFSCKKYPDGPSFTLLSKKERLENSWAMSKAYEDGVDKTGDYQSAFKDYNLIFTKSGAYSYSYSFYGFYTVSENGNWVFNSDKTKLIFDPASNNDANYEWTILRLKDEELWARDDDYNGKKLEIHLIPK
jgi:hypothetical protein